MNVDWGILAGSAVGLAGLLFGGYQWWRAHRRPDPALEFHLLELSAREAICEFRLRNQAPETIRITALMAISPSSLKISRAEIGEPIDREAAVDLYFGPKGSETRWADGTVRNNDSGWVQFRLGWPIDWCGGKVTCGAKFIVTSHGDDIRTVTATQRIVPPGG
ncbi:MAG TPA: hypothetical protein VFE34_08275 [Dongiaceae bacterium]|jgi:hypothetical protein|nr:hypothetical protein [Dongiaceae bacterium]